MSELGHPDARGTLSDLEDDIIGILARDPKRPLIIDESDKLVDRNMIELVRMIAKKSNVPVLLIGEELFPKSWSVSIGSAISCLNGVCAALRSGRHAHTCPDVLPSHRCQG
ncbi:hypothetical protein HGG75_04885 [Ochrobactrum pseudogrignonense]|nr:hypothetical protein [Brucella pseudogrignonensis]